MQTSRTGRLARPLPRGQKRQTSTVECAGTPLYAYADLVCDVRGGRGPRLARGPKHAHPPAHVERRVQLTGLRHPGGVWSSAAVRRLRSGGARAPDLRAAAAVDTTRARNPGGFARNLSPGGCVRRRRAVQTCHGTRSTVSGTLARHATDTARHCRDRPQRRDRRGAFSPAARTPCRSSYVPTRNPYGAVQLFTVRRTSSTACRRTDSMRPEAVPVIGHRQFE